MRRTARARGFIVSGAKQQHHHARLGTNLKSNLEKIKPLRHARIKGVYCVLALMKCGCVRGLVGAGCDVAVSCDYHHLMDGNVWVRE